MPVSSSWEFGFDSRNASFSLSMEVTSVHQGSWMRKVLFRRHKTWKDPLYLACSDARKACLEVARSFERNECVFALCHCFRRFPRREMLAKSRKICKSIFSCKRLWRIKRLIRKTKRCSVVEFSWSILQIFLHSRANAKKDERKSFRQLFFTILH